MQCNRWMQMTAVAATLVLAACGDRTAEAAPGDATVAAASAPEPAMEAIGPLALAERAAGFDAAGGIALQPAGVEEAPVDTIDLRRLGYDRGRADAPVVVVEFSDFGCTFCAMFATSTYPTLHREFVATGRVRWKYVPFVMGMFPNGDEAARTAECAAEQGKFWEMHDRLFTMQREWKRRGSSAALFAGYAREIGLHAGRFASCYREDRGGARTRANNRAADAARIRATPSFIINGRLVEGALPVETFRQVLTAAGGRE
ncbi:MAG TPA: thioredoxin domain-containing protein [Longimicrobium sp.]|nr:thioredoxin domain-containing protein [Longimicrobium sp.]